MEGDQCSRCLLGSLTVDEQEGFLLCPNCGFLADEVHLVNNPLGGEGVTVGDHAAGGGAAIMPGSGTSGFRRGTGAAPSSHDRGRREAVDRLKGVASRLMPTGMVQEAVNMFHEVRERKLLRIGSEHYTVDAQIAGVLFTVLRSHNQPMPLSEVASACQASPLVVGRHFRTLASALHMPALFPSATIRAFAMRLAAKLLESLNCDQVRGLNPVSAS
ncbi:hypothetical protein DUNSADRAFT_10787 [Dunaliella salina]|uniref:TFIIB-type domain-containing protein n=1 Tax=Dunaliella salina TaxID=3046 RepID=A0ABQ7H9T0_DUNSA|nr:hypothetical protein DUNSADRAFT_10787 [Dunaliella salina]|eukprot:KAF5843612.1 hypothetical protein DUNSADRAFT_10787 [Dunaliella salina]